MASPNVPANERSDKPARSRGEQARSVAGVALIVYAVVFAIVNFDRVKVDWIVTSGRTPLVIVIAFSALAGALVAWLMLRSRGKRD